MKNKSTKKKLAGIFVTMVTLSLLFWSASCSTTQHAYHAYIMRGSVVETAEGSVYVCIGTNDGAKVGQELNVHRVEVIRSGSSKTPTRFIKKKVGTVRIAEIVDDHFANATILSGEVKKNDIVEFEMK